jgi:hypothetical protein
MLEYGHHWMQEGVPGLVWMSDKTKVGAWEASLLNSGRQTIRPYTVIQEAASQAQDIPCKRTTFANHGDEL